MPRWLRFVPLVAALGVAAIPLWQYGQRLQAEAAGEAFLRQFAEAQLAFRRAHPPNFATALESLTMACAGEPGTALDPGAVRTIRARGFDLVVRPAQGAAEGTADCHGRPTAADYYAALQPSSSEAAPRQAYGLTGLSGRVFVFFDGLAPLENDMAPGGLATPLDTLSAFRIP
jgi:hypothetical protein